jgi:hypothetical protein
MRRISSWHTRVIEPTGGPAAALPTLEDAARFVGLLNAGATT